MTVSRSSTPWRYADPQRLSRVDRPHQEERRVAHSGRLGTGTLACARCDAPVALGAAARSPLDRLGCPFCGHQALLREFLSLALPTRPARVTLRVRHTPAPRG